ncbi:MAG: metal-dependent transcriptional regulator [Dehalococcoidia bacterium]|nr:metal-dependent transcriptional regulator [Dehalococcoidia bacterium]
MTAIARMKTTGVSLHRTRYSANMEDYLEAIRVLAFGGSPVTVTQLSDALNVSKPSVTSAIAKLSREGLVAHERYGAVQLTARGKLVAEDVCHRHEALKVFLTEILGVPQETAEEDACKLEHHLSQDSSMRLTHFIDYVLKEDGGRPAWLEEFVADVDGRSTASV